MGKTHITWTEGEQRQIVDAVCDLLEKDPFMSFIALLRKAMPVALFPDRVRNVQSITTVPWFKTRVKRTMEERSRNTKGKEDKDTEKHQAVTSDVASVSTDDLLAEVMRRLLFTPLRNEMTRWLESSHVITRVSSEIVAGLRGSLQNGKEPAEPAKKPAKTRVLVVGLLNEQRQTITKEWGDLLDIKFCDNGAPNLYDLARSCSNTVLMTKFTSHTNQEIAKSSGTKILWCNGGVTELERVLTKVFDGC